MATITSAVLFRSESKAWFPLHDKCHDHNTKTKRL